MAATPLLPRLGKSVKVVVGKCDTALLVQLMLKRDVWAFEAC